MKPKNQNIPILCIIICLLFFNSCARNPLYTAKTSHLLTLSEKEDLAVTAIADLDIMDEGTLKNEHQFMLQAAYSPIQNLVVSTNTNLLFPKSKDTVYRKGFDYDLAVGYYKRFHFNPSAYNEIILVEAFSTFGQGTYSNVFTSDFRQKVNYNRFGAQFGLYYQDVGSFYYSVGFIYRPAILKFSKLLFVGEANSDLVEELNSKNGQSINEFSFNIKFGAPQVALNINLFTLHEFGKRKLNLVRNHGIQLGLVFSIDAFLRED